MTNRRENPGVGGYVYEGDGMSRYVKDRKCEKCGGEMSVRWIGKGERLAPPNRPTQPTWADHEVIRRHCQTCHYERDELPLDADAAQ